MFLFHNKLQYVNGQGKFEYIFDKIIVEIEVGKRKREIMGD